MAWTKQPLHPHFGTLLSGADADAAMDPALRIELMEEIGKSGLVALRGQHLDEDSLGALARTLGPKLMSIPTTIGRRGDVFRIANFDLDGNILPPTDSLVTRNVANEFWHTDMTYVRPRATVSMLYARVIPDHGGETQFCDTRRAYERLPAAEQARLRPLKAGHSVMHTRAATGYNSWTDAERAVYGTPVERPLVQLHAESGRFALCLATYICQVTGMTPEEAVALRTRLIDHASAPEEVYTHHWKPGDLLLWDNRCTMHRLAPWDQATQKRELLTTRLVELADA